MTEGEEAFRGLLNRIDAGFCVIEVIFDGVEPVDYRFIELNPAFVHQTGMVDAHGKLVSEVLPSHEPYWYQLYGQVARTGESLQFEREARALGRWYSVEAVSFGAPGSNQVAVLFFDVTRRKQMELELAESEARFSALADGLPVPVWVLDEHGHPRFINAAFSEFFGMDERSLPANLWDDQLHEQDVALMRFELGEALREQRSMHSLVRARRRDGQWRWVEMSAHPRFSPRGHFVGLAGSSPDVTEQREIELAREQLLESERSARNAAETTARLKDEFLATLSHELRTPLTTILGWSELLLQRIDDKHPLHKGLKVIAGSAMAQRELISDMLDLSSMLLGKVQLEVEALDMCEQVHEAVRAQELVARDKELSLTVDCQEGPHLSLGDATRLQQVLANLLTNAIKFTPAHGSIHVELRSDGAHHRIAIRDSGDGIAPEFLKHLFGRFRQADGTTTRRHGGLGLGLSIVQQLVELHGGNVSASSDGPGCGATFTIELPAYQQQDGRPLREVVQGPIAERMAPEPHALKGLRLLAVEDQPDVLEYLRRLLEEHGAEVTVAGSAGEALEVLDNGGHTQIDVMLTDIGMPGMDGYGLVRAVRESLGLQPTTLPVVAVTALAREDDRRRAMSSGFQAHVAKPYSVGQLVGAVRQVHLQR